MSKQAMLRVVAVALVLIAGVAFIAMVARTPVPAKTRPRTVDDPQRTIAKRLPRDEQLRAEPLPAELEPLRAIAVPKVAPEPGDWLAEHPEDGQSIAQHKVDCVPAVGKTIYLVPLGALDAKATVVLKKLELLLAAHFQLRVKQLPPLPASVAGKSERDGQIGKQWLTDDILTGLLKVRPDDAAAVMAFTTVDLYPDPSWNFVFGQASYDERVGVMSVARVGDLELEPELVLERAYATGMHEIGHMLRILHCIAWECPMNGCNHQAESDSRPLEPCPHCLAKLIRATGLDPQKRWTDLRAEFDRAGLQRGVKEIDAELAALARAADAGVSSSP